MVVPSDSFCTVIRAFMMRGHDGHMGLTALKNLKSTSDLKYGKDNGCQSHYSSALQFDSRLEAFLETHSTEDRKS